jgi:nucleotide-binding universal stress UspA family protein
MATNILVAVDGTDAARSALEWATALVEHKRARGETVAAAMINVCQPAETFGVDGFGLPAIAEGIRRAADVLDHLDHDVPSAADFEHLVKSGSVATGILDEARARDADLIVVGTRHEGAVRQALMGSVSQRLAAERERPVAVVPAGSEPMKDLVVVGYDGSPGARSAIQWALDHCEGQLRVIRAVANDGDELAARESIHALLPALGPSAEGRVVAETIVGDPVEALLDPSHETPQIVVGARKDSDGSTNIWGSTATQLLADTTRPVVVVPPAHG